MRRGPFSGPGAGLPNGAFTLLHTLCSAEGSGPKSPAFPGGEKAEDRLAAETGMSGAAVRRYPFPGVSRRPRRTADGKKTALPAS